MARILLCATLVVALGACGTSKPWTETGDGEGRRASGTARSGPVRDDPSRGGVAGQHVDDAQPSRGPTPRVPSASGAPKRPDIQDAHLRFLNFPAGGDRVVATMGEDALHRSQVFEYMLATMPDQVRASIAVLVGNRHLAAECAEHGITVPESEINRWYTARLSVLAERAKLEYGKDTTIERYLTLTRAQSPTEFERVEKNRERARRLMERAIRFRAMLEDRVELRIISLTDRGLALQVREQLDRGADFATLAKERSVHPSAERGGQMYPVWREALNPTLQGPAFTLPVGSISDVLHTRDDAGRDRFQIVKVLKRHKGRRLRYADVEDEIASGLQKTPLSQDEYLMWQLRINRLVELEL